MIFGMTFGRTVRFATLLLMIVACGSFASPVRDTDTPPRTTGGRVDINHASNAELKTLPGIQDAFAAAIVKNRPYKNKLQLLSKQVIPEAAYGKIKNKIVAKQ